VAQAYRERGVTMLIAGAKGPVRDVLDKSGLDGELGPDARFRDIAAAMEAAQDRLAGRNLLVRPTLQGKPRKPSSAPA
jgi:hypothetical protein